MADERVQRRLAAILAADVVGYSRLMEQDEAGTLAALKERRKHVLTPMVSEHEGRIVKVMGDGVLVEFGSAVNAVACAVELQKCMAIANNGIAEDRRIALRVGINLGDVVVEGGDLYGDGVIIAVRLQAMAEPGGICLAGSVYEQVGNKLPLAFEDLGPCEIKNVTRPVRAFRIQAGPQGSQPPPERQPAPLRPSIAVLPFTNMSGDPEQQYFSDGITEDMITELSRFRSLFVIARNSSFQFRDKAVDVRRVARELGVLYVVEGGIRKVGAQLRITAQLIEATTGKHIWSERYDRSLSDVFAVQDEVVQAIVARVAGQLSIFEFQRARRKRTEHLGAYDCYLRGLDCWRDAGPDADTKSNSWFERALELDAEFADPLALLCISKGILAFYNDSPDRFEPVLAMANKAVALDPNNSWSHCALGFAKLASGSVAASATHFDTAMRLNPNDPDQMKWCALYHIYSGNFDVAREMTAAADRLNPMPPPWYQNGRAVVEYGLRNYAAAARHLEGLGTSTFYWDHCYLAACYERLGRMPEAKLEIAKALRIKPNLTVGEVAIAEPYVRPDDLEHLLEPLRKAGLPE